MNKHAHLRLVVRQRECGFCNGQMEKGDQQFCEQMGSTLRVWCLACARIRLDAMEKGLGDIRRAIDDELKKNPDRYVRTALTAKDKR